MILKYFYKGCQLPHYGNPRRACSGLPKIEKTEFCNAGLIKDSSVSTLALLCRLAPNECPAGRAKRVKIDYGENK